MAGLDPAIPGGLAAMMLETSAFPIVGEMPGSSPGMTMKEVDVGQGGGEP